MKDENANNDMTDVSRTLYISIVLINFKSFQVWKQLREAKAKELEMKKQLNTMYRQKV